MKLAASLEKEGIDYCLVGGNALKAHGFDRATTDIDLLMTEDSLKKFVETHVGRGYARRFAGAKTKFLRAVDKVPIDIVVTGAFPGNEQTEVPFPEPSEISFEGVVFPDNDQMVRVADLINLINLKLVCYKDLPEHRPQDLVDVRRLIQCNKLDGAFADNLHPSVREIFLRAVKLEKEVEEMEKEEEI